MALTWRDTYRQPTADVSGLVRSGELIGKAFTGAGTSLQDFALRDQTAKQGVEDVNNLSALARYTDPTKLNEALQTNAFGGASPDVLKAAMGRTDALIRNAANQQVVDRAAVINPLEAERVLANQPGILAGIAQQDKLRAISDPVSIETAQQRAAADRLLSQNIVSDTEFGIKTKADERANAGFVKQVTDDISSQVNAGSLLSPNDANAYVQGLIKKGAPNAAVNAATGILRQRFGEAVGPLILPSGATTVRETGSGVGATDSYNVVYGNGKNGLPVPAKPLVESTIGEAVDWGKNVLIPATKGTLKNQAKDVGTSAMGKYQFTQETLNDIAPKVLGNNWRDLPFDKANQDRLGEFLFNARKGGNLKSTWEGLPNATPGAYANLPWSEMKEIISSVESAVPNVSQSQAGAIGATINKAAQAIGNATSSQGLTQRYKAALSESPTTVTESSSALAKANPGLSQSEIESVYADITKQTGSKDKPGFNDPNLLAEVVNQESTI